MSIQEQIKLDMVSAMKNREVEKSNLLKVVIGEFGRSYNISKFTDEDALAILKKMRENAVLMNNQFEINILDTYIPKNLDENEVKNIVKSTIESVGATSLKEMGKVMAELKNHPKSSQIDKKLASDYIKELLN